MMTYSKKDVVSWFESEGREIPEFVRDAPDNYMFAAGQGFDADGNYGHIGLHVSGQIIDGKYQPLDTSPVPRAENRITIDID